MSPPIVSLLMNSVWNCWLCFGPAALVFSAPNITAPVSVLSRILSPDLDLPEYLRLALKSLSGSRGLLLFSWFSVHELTVKLEVLLPTRSPSRLLQTHARISRLQRTRLLDLIRDWPTLFSSQLTLPIPNVSLSYQYSKNWIPSFLALTFVPAPISVSLSETFAIALELITFFQSIWYHCKQVEHCGLGMVGAINGKYIIAVSIQKIKYKSSLCIMV